MLGKFLVTLKLSIQTNYSLLKKKKNYFRFGKRSGDIKNEKKMEYLYGDHDQNFYLPDRYLYLQRK